MSNKGEKENGKRTSVRGETKEMKRKRHGDLMNGNKEIKSGTERKEEMTRKRNTRKRIERKRKPEIKKKEKE